MPEMGLEEEPISPVSREETVTNRKPNTTIRAAPRRFMCKVRAARMASINATMPPPTNFIDRSLSVRAMAARPVAARRKSVTPARMPRTILGSERPRLMMPPAATAPAPIYST